jgi:hypothetical protein
VSAQHNLCSDFVAYHRCRCCRRCRRWFNIIWVPQTYATIYLLLGSSPAAVAGGFPTPAELSAGLRDMFRAAWWNASLGYEVSGANLAWMLQV